MTERQLAYEWQVGSRLYGSATDASDNDLLRIWYPTLEELVSNKAVTIAQSIGDSDVRNITLSEFVMSLGKNNENTLTAIHYEGRLGIDPAHYVNRKFVLELHKTGENMQRFAKTAKIYAHGFRYRALARRLALGQFTKYPLLDADLSRYKQLRAFSDEDAQGMAAGWRADTIGEETIKSSKLLSDNKIATTVLVRWLWDVYMDLYGREMDW